MKEIKWNADRDRFTQRQAERLAYGAIVRLVQKIQAMPEMKDREDAENALAILLSEVPALPSLAMPTGLSYIDKIKRNLARERHVALEKGASAQRRKIVVTDPLAVAAQRQEAPTDLRSFALVMMRKTEEQRTIPLARRSS